MRYFSVFSGIRGFEQAFPDDWECVGYSEIDPYCKTCHKITYQKYIKIGVSQCQECGKTKVQHAEAISKYHYPNHKNYGDARRIIWKTIPDFDFLCFGWPCQDNSIAGGRKGQTGNTRSGLLTSAVKGLRIKKPRYFIAENVPGLLSVNKGIDIIETFKLLTWINDSLPQYTIQCQLLNTRWFLPQNRLRLYIIGHLRGESRPEVFPIGEGAGGCEEENAPSWVSNGEGIAYALNTHYNKGASKRSRTLVTQRGKGKVNEIASTITAGAKSGGDHSQMDLIVEEGLIELTHNLPTSQRVYDPHGVSTTIKGVGGGKGAKTGLYAIDLKAMKSKTRRGTVKMDESHALDTQNYMAVSYTRDKQGKITSYNLNEEYGTVKQRAGNQSGYVANKDFAVRRLTPFECCLLQGYNKIGDDPEDCYTKYGIVDGKKIKISDTAQYKCIGNGVSTPVVRAAIKPFLKMNLIRKGGKTNAKRETE